MRRWLVAETGLAFPGDPEPLLRFFDLRQREGAARTSYSSTLNALKFFELAGEVRHEDCIHEAPALVSAAKEAAAGKAKESAEGDKSGRKQAPALPLAVLVGLEVAGLDSVLQLFVRAYARYRR